MSRRSLLLAAFAIALLTGLACRRGVPVVDAGPRPADAAGTISGTIRGPEGTGPVVKRQVEVIDLDSGERQRMMTTNGGGFTFKVRPGKYRVEVGLLEGESVIKRPGVMDVNRSDGDVHADFILGNVRLSRPRVPAVQKDNGLGPPIA